MFAWAVSQKLGVSCVSFRLSWLTLARTTDHSSWQPSVSLVTFWHQRIKMYPCIMTSAPFLSTPPLGPPANAGDARDTSWSLGLEESLGVGRWQLTPLFLLKNSRTEEPGGLPVHGLTKSQARLSSSHEEACCLVVTPVQNDSSPFLHFQSPVPMLPKPKTTLVLYP